MAEVSPLTCGLLSRCPRCGQGALFQGFLTVKERCDSCGLILRQQDSGDGPAAFIILIVGFVVVGAALIVEVRFQPPIWLHLALWLPVTVVGCLALMRPFKATLIALQYRHRRGEFGRDDPN